MKCSQSRQNPTGVNIYPRCDRIQSMSPNACQVNFGWCEGYYGDDESCEGAGRGRRAATARSEAVKSSRKLKEQGGVMIRGRMQFDAASQTSFWWYACARSRKQMGQA
jgi:hypothetical protein